MPHGLLVAVMINTVVHQHSQNGVQPMVTAANEHTFDQ